MSISPSSTKKNVLCFLPEKPLIEKNCEAGGVFSPIAGVLGSLQANEVLKTIIGLKNGLDNQMMIFDSIKINFIGTAGQSFGELSALWAAGVLEDKDYYLLAHARGKAMAAPDDPDFDAGSMLAVMGKVDQLEKELKEFPEVKMANLNSKKQVVLAGPKAVSYTHLRAHET